MAGDYLYKKAITIWLIMLVLQKKFPLLLGQILRYLNYVQPHELRSVLSGTHRS